MALTTVPSQLISKSYLPITLYSGQTVQANVTNGFINVTLYSGATSNIPVN
jgi:hypothetical protein